MVFDALSPKVFFTPDSSPAPSPCMTTRIKMPKAMLKPVNPVRNGLLKTVWNISSQASRSNMLELHLIFDETVFQSDDAVALLGDFMLMGDNNDGDAFAIDFLEQFHDILGCG